MEDAARMERRLYQARWREKNRDHIRAYRRDWNARNTDRVRAHTERYWARKAQERMDEK